MRREDFFYHLPEELIAQYPPEKRGDSRLLCLDGNSGVTRDRHFSNLPELLMPGDLLVFNDTQVMAARLHGHKQSGGRVELLIERLVDTHNGLAHIRASKSPKPDSKVIVGNGAEIEITGRQDSLFKIRSLGQGLLKLMEQYGHMPLPPYIDRDDSELDESRYQTVYAERPGAVAAPTAGLHFDKAMLEKLDQMGIKRATVTLHVGAGTFQPVRVDNLDEHIMHSEYVEVSEETCSLIQKTRSAGRRVVAVGTTSVRSLESASQSGEIQPFFGDTRLFIRPGYRYKSVDALITNFHLPESTLLMLVSAFSGYDHIMAAYRHAIAERYRFFSYGDAMFLTQRTENET
ncbi:MAG: tRNA preQ1(34) S-adenosylmethionine ribosyltransferase-isomerase QueA [Chromatiales bacterium]|nr:tRNA preQ1(34) S-adenosylmethionine ribosyltransferase-isomerase QueA [Chromatiales bacterium]